MEGTKAKQEEADAKAKEEDKEPAPVEPVFKYEPKTVTDWAVQNDNKPLWTRTPRDVRLPRRNLRFCSFMTSCDSFQQSSGTFLCRYTCF